MSASRVKWMALFAVFASRTAAAARPTPDRPSVSATGRLIAPGTLEAEAGGQWQQGFTAPALVKYNLGGFEPRLGVDLSGVGSGAPGMTGAAKVAALDSPNTAVSIYAVSAIPIGPSEAWWGSARLLVDAAADAPVGITVNAGLDFVGSSDGALALDGFPVSLAFSGRLFNSISAFGEGACKIDAGIGGWIIDAGLGWNLTEILILDTAAGWDFDAESPFVHLGGTVNVGRLGG